MYCQKCGAEVKEGAKFCAKCGAAQTSVVPASSAKSRKSALFFFIAPFALFIIILVVWGLVNILVTTFGGASSGAFRVFKLLIPFIILLNVLFVPTGIIIGIVRLLDKE